MQRTQSDSMTTVAQIVCTAATLALAMPAAATAADVMLQVRDDEPIGEHIADGKGMTLYRFETDGNGQSQCHDACAKAWPPLLADGDVSVGGELDADKVSTVERREGSRQVTYGGAPLYYFVNDGQPGETNGQEVEGFGAEWYAVRPSAMKAEGEEHEEEDDGGGHSD